MSDVLVMGLKKKNIEILFHFWSDMTNLGLICYVTAVLTVVCLDFFNVQCN